MEFFSIQVALKLSIKYKKIAEGATATVLELSKLAI
jgi:hypothetical protein